MSDHLLAETSARQARAADPAVSAWVSANAGTGKTHVLARRVLRLLLAGTAPERILCLTFTKAAAAEMSARVFGELSQWVTADKARLGSMLAKHLDREASGDERLLARRLFARTIETPGGLKVQTIHAFAERILQRFPLEAGVAPGFSILDEATAAEVTRGAVDAMLSAATSAPAMPLGRALETAVAFAAEEGFDSVLSQVRVLGGKAHELLVDARSEDGMAGIEVRLRKLLGVRQAVDRGAIASELTAVATDLNLSALAEVLRRGKPNDQKMMAHVEAARAAASGEGRVDALTAYFLVGKGKNPRKDLMTKDLRQAHLAIHEAVKDAQLRFFELDQERKAVTVLEASLAILRLAADVEARYREAKARRAALDYADLIERTSALLGRTGEAQWVLYKLDGGIDHILVDEAQDTSATQWQIIERLAGEFHSGESARESHRTLFAVGDEKQSIYSFQGAEPRLFAAMGAVFEQRARAAEAAFARIALDLSFRSTAPVLAAVDAVFAGPSRPAGVTAADEAVRHVARRQGAAGLVEIWDTEKAAPADEPDVWLPFEKGLAAPPAVRLAERIALTIRGWLDRGEVLRSAGRPIRASDVLILVRKRQPFAVPMIRALKAKDVRVAGADRIRIADELAVMDLLALGDVLLLPGDDLALATVLKSPLFGLEDDDLFRLAHGRKGTLWQVLAQVAKAGSEPRMAAAAAELAAWRREVDFSPPFELLSRILDRDPRDGRGPVRARLLGRLGVEAVEAIEELLHLALVYEEGATPSLQGFIGWMRSGGAEVKRDMEQGRDEVRVMTVHGAKGLEAPIVFLADTCSRKRGGFGARIVPARSPDGARHVLWPVAGTSGIGAIQAAKVAQDEEDAREYHRLLYVAMTRARDRLYVAGFEGAKGREKGCWYDLVHGALSSGMQRAEDGGRPIWRTATTQRDPVEGPGESAGRARATPPLPAWALRAAPREPVRAIPLAPSRLAPLELEAGDSEAADEEGVADVPPRPALNPAQPVASPGALSRDNRLLRGEITHALLEHLPAVSADRERVAQAFVARRGSALPEVVRRSIAAEAVAVLSDPALSALFGPEARAEVPIAAMIAPPDGRGAPLHLSGQIDRLVELPDAILILDYKTNRPPPREVEGVADAYLLQLAAYRLALSHTHPGKRIRAALLWTYEARLMEIPAALLDDFERRLWTLADAPP